MSGAALDVLDTIRRHGGDVKIIAPDRLKVFAPPDLLAEFVKQVRAVKPQLIATLAAAACPCEPIVEVGTARARDASWWQRRLIACSFQWLLGDRDWEEATHLAWGDLQSGWHDIHGRRWPTWQCAGCDRPIGGLEVLDLSDGNRVHLDPIDCLITFGKRWRGAATAALVELGLEPPSGTE
jgi:hypothetical protein